jgi:hypothetical protein
MINIFRFSCLGLLILGLFGLKEKLFTRFFELSPMNVPPADLVGSFFLGRLREAV